MGQRHRIAQTDAAKSSGTGARRRDPPETPLFLPALSCRQRTGSDLTLSSIL